MAELGQIFSQLAHMVAVQGEQVTRIDADTEDIAANVTGAQSCVALLILDQIHKSETDRRDPLRTPVDSELLRYYASVSSNRWLMLKVSLSRCSRVDRCPELGERALTRDACFVPIRQVFGVLIIFFLVFVLVS